MASLHVLKRMTDSLMKLKSARGFEFSCSDKIRVISADSDNCVCEMTVEKDHVNRFGTMHGGCVATVVDLVSGVYLCASTDNPYINSTVDLNVSFLKAANVGEDIVIEAKNLKIGKKLSFLDVVIKRKRDGQLVATGKQTLFMTSVKHSLFEI